jgi:hypothetical protein
MEIISQIEKRLSVMNIMDDDLFSYLYEIKRLSDNDMLFADAIKNSKARWLCPILAQQQGEPWL